MFGRQNASETRQHNRKIRDLRRKPRFPRNQNGKNSPFREKHATRKPSDPGKTPENMTTLARPWPALYRSAQKGLVLIPVLNKPVAVRLPIPRTFSP
ncbi:MAG TPA: hypothetical protein VIM46_07905 [Luteolibacter sp.]